MRFAALVGIGGKRRSPDLLALVDIKEAVAAAAPSFPGAIMPMDHAERVVAGARALAPNLGHRMIATHLLDGPVVVRELMPQDLKLEIDQFSRVEARRAAHYLAFVVGRAHARQMDKAVRNEWRTTLAQRGGGSLDAPSWLWDSIIDLSAAHEAGYLEHCRRFALSEATAAAA